MHPTAEPSTPATGRSAVLDELAEAATHPQALLTIGGEAGIGKTHLVTSLLAHPALRSRRPLIGRCLELEQPLPLAPVIEAATCLPPPTTALAPLTGALRPLLPDLAAHLPPEPPPLADGGTARHRQMRALHSLLASAGPATLVFEDVQWADAATRDFLRHLIAHQPANLTLVLTHRTDPQYAATVRSVHATRPPATTRHTPCQLEPLDTADLTAWASHVLTTGAVSPAVIQALRHHTAGIPAAVTAVLQLLAAQPAPASRANGTSLQDLGVPPTVREDVLAALDALSDDARDIVRAAAVAGPRADLAVLSSMIQLPAVATTRALHLATSHALLHPGPADTYSLRHPLAQQAVLDELDGPQLRALHLRAARALLTAHPGPPPLGRIAQHYRQAGRVEAWLRFAEVAAGRGAASTDHHAARHLLDALAAAPSPHQRIRLARKLGRTTLDAPSSHEAVDILRQVIAQDNPNPDHRGELRLYLGLLLRNQAGAGLAGMDEIARAVPDLHTQPELAARAMTAIAIPSITGWPIADHLAWLERARRLASDIHDPALRTAIAVNHASALMFTADPLAWPAAAELPDTADTCAEKIEIARGNINLAHAAAALGHSDRARDFLSCAHANLHPSSTYLSGLAQTADLLLAWTTGQWHALDTHAGTVATDFADIPDVAAEAILVRGLHALAARCNLPHARTDLLLAARTTRFDTGVVLPASAGALARMELAADNFHQAAAATHPVLAHIRRTAGWMWATDIAPCAVAALVGQEQYDQARELIEEFTAGITGRDAPAAQAALITSQALLEEATGLHRDAVEHFEHAARCWHAAHRPYEAAQAIEAEGRCLLTLSADDGHALFAQAIDAYSRLGAAWDIARARSTLRSHGVVLAHRRGPRGYGDRLSPRELDVARLAATGNSNRQIADALSLSPRTVEHHIAKALHKLGTSRHALAASLSNHGENEPSQRADPP
ncbi:AAA family ATPase [Streptomyces sp. NPDC006733]|uniref:ATP-binding protein n=1 Tax=Streptomyces sp. NPDC006733 TaxID=3155460 RepID=UPI0033F972AE